MTAVTFLVTFPFMQVMVIFFISLLTIEGEDCGAGAAGLVECADEVEIGEGDGVGVGDGFGVGVGAMYLTLIVGVENVKPLALK